MSGLREKERVREVDLVGLEWRVQERSDSVGGGGRGGYMCSHEFRNAWISDFERKDDSMAKFSWTVDS